MAVLTDEQRAELRRAVASASEVVTWDKSAINAALQACEDWYEAERPVVSGLIDTATSPFVFTNPQKKMLARYFLRQKFSREGE
jgi:hypothetical protein